MHAPPVSACAVQELSGAVDWLRLVGGLSRRPAFWWLDSALVDGRLGRFSFAGAEPWCVLRSRGRRNTWEVHRAARLRHRPGRRTQLGDPLEALRTLLPASPLASAPLALPIVDGQLALPFVDGQLALPFAGGVLVAFSYELGATLEPVAVAAADPLALPDLTAFGVDRLYACDHATGRVYALAWAEGAEPESAARGAEHAVRALAEALPDAEPPPAPGPIPRALEIEGGFDAESHAKTVDQIHAAIAAGDLYQACLTHRLTLPYAGDPFALAGALRRINPAPFACLLSLPDATLVGSSPERFLRVSADRWVESRPIKGTRPRGVAPAEDRALRDELAHAEKDRAENLMIVDLVRNDLGRVCEPGSVHVPELFAVETHASVFQLVSTVRGRLAPGHDALDAVRAAFPPGSMTGAPKLAAMELLAKLEPVRRGLYSGAVGYLDLRGGADLSVTIRSIILAGGRAHLHCGGGIVADSTPAAEWREAEDKARALLAALATASGAPTRP